MSIEKNKTKIESDEKNNENENVRFGSSENAYPNMALFVNCPTNFLGEFNELSIKIDEFARPEILLDLLEFFYKNYPEVFWEYLVKMKSFFVNGLFYSKEFIEFLIKIIPDDLPDCNFSISLMKMPLEPKYRRLTEAEEYERVDLIEGPVKNEEVYYSDFYPIQMSRDINGNPIDKIIELELEIETDGYVPTNEQIKKVINWLEENSGFVCNFTNIKYGHSQNNFLNKINVNNMKVSLLQM